ncbi:plasmid replication, integration and excision activator [Knoellia sinensis KCTC 19936]|uniref:Plasmid replication, integration and excision activator n=1 Tax=Knoellia sinensis KCTC 19936 TaxID=1385520 RepID=A0A0A0J6B9_9MICO|nr:hypothetical protein [Knoellia sinensis]KGN31136.1 plasmid replication, integration and excision activator [Knoellia sinensis KCTC 19936]
MALAGRFPIAHDVAFPGGAYLVSEVTPVYDFDRSTKDNKVQQVDKDNGLLLWQIDVVDPDPNAPRKQKTVSVKFAAKVQPVPPSNDGSSPFTPVEFEGLTALAYIQESGDFSSVVYSYKASGMKSPGRPASSRPAGDGKAA